MPKWEVCRIQYRLVKRRGIFSPAKYKWCAIVDTQNGEEIIDASIEIEDHDDARNVLLQNEEASKLTGRLLAKGWEPMESSYGRVSVLKRHVA
ncbi:MAG TPA: hypothetical protein VFD70_28975 [Anaerolineae bacterium]|nr:hypothetical protein [Anaerolineae bacterium]